MKNRLLAELTRSMRASSRRRVVGRRSGSTPNMSPRASSCRASPALPAGSGPWPVFTSKAPRSARSRGQAPDPRGGQARTACKHGVRPGPGL